MKHEHTTSNSTAHKTDRLQSRWMSEEGLSRFQGQVVDTAKEAYDALIDVSSDALATANRRASKVIREYPVQATAGALAIGFLFGAWVSRRKS